MPKSENVSAIAIVCISLGACATAPPTTYDEALAANDEEWERCRWVGGLPCQERVNAERQQLVAEEMASRQRSETRRQTAALQSTLAASNAAAPQPNAESERSWCMLVVDGTNAREGCFADQTTCELMRSDLQAAGRASTQCAEKASERPARVETGERCLAAVEPGGTTVVSCYPSASECEAARGYAVAAGIARGSCEAPEL